MQLTVWTYEGPPHVGAMRVVTGMKNVHYVLHAPQGDTYADLLFTMIERRDHRPPVTYTTFQARDLGSDTAELFQESVRDAYQRYQPDVLVVGASCTAELIQDDPGGLSEALDLPVPVVPVELPAYQRKENWGASETFYQIVRRLAGPQAPPPGTERAPIGPNPTCNILGPCGLGFRHRDDVQEVTKLLHLLGVEVRTTAPLGAGRQEIAELGSADFNVVLYPEIASSAASWLKRSFRQPMVTTIPIGMGATREFVREVATLLGRDPDEAEGLVQSNLPWWSRSVDSTYLTGKRVFVFGDATHAVAAARVARDEMGFEVVGLGAYNREFAREVRAAAKDHGVEPLITDDYLEVERAIEEAAPELVLGTQMERHIAKRLGLFCAVISAPVHVQDFPARYSPQMGPEGTNVLFDSWIHPLVMGLEEHLLGMFQDDFEFGNGALPSHLAAEAPAAAPVAASDDADGADHQGEATAVDGATSSGDVDPDAELVWTKDATAELKKIPFFVRGKAKRNTEAYAADQGINPVTVDTLYEAKAHFGSRSSVGVS